MLSVYGTWKRSYSGQRGQIDVLARRNVSIKKISIQLRRSRKAIASYLANPGDYAKKEFLSIKTRKVKRQLNAFTTLKATNRRHVER
jgi:hypothetical protein